MPFRLEALLPTVLELLTSPDAAADRCHQADIPRYIVCRNITHPESADAHAADSSGPFTQLHNNSRELGRAVSLTTSGHVA